MRQSLKDFACQASRSQGRRFAEKTDAMRSEFQRDRDRIVHSSAFRRLVYKTQVFLNHEGDLFRTRLTHSLEVAQLSRSIARMLELDESLVEAIALAHDLGHTPFGHAGQHALNASLKEAGSEQGFEHNMQSLRVVDQLEVRYPEWDGLNLCLETRAGILKHCSAANAKYLNHKEPHGVAHRFTDGAAPSLEAQLCNVADEIAYNAHDIDDGIRSGLITLEQLDELALWVSVKEQILQDYPALKAYENQRRLLAECIRRILNEQVYDVVSASLQNVSLGNLKIGFSMTMHAQVQSVKLFLSQNLYKHPRVMEQTDAAQEMVKALFTAYLSGKLELPVEFKNRPKRLRSIADYIAGMTDRFAIVQYQKLQEMA